MEKEKKSLQRMGAICDPAPVVQISPNQSKDLVERGKEAAKNRCLQAIQSLNQLKSAVEMKETVLLCTDLYV